MTNLSIQWLFFVMVALVPAYASSAQPETGLSDREAQTIKKEIQANDLIIVQLRNDGQPIPAKLKTVTLSRFYPYSPNLTESELGLARAILYSIGRISAEAPLARDFVDDVIVWMIEKGWGEQALVESSRNANLDSAQFERLIDGLLASEEPLDDKRKRTIARLMEEGAQSAADFDLLGERLLAMSDGADRRLLINWLLRANRAGKLNQSPVAARALLFNADQVPSPRVRLATLIESNSDPDLLQHLAGLAVAKDSEHLTEFLMSIDLPDEILLSLEPLAASKDRYSRFGVAGAIVKRYGAGINGTAWLISKSEEQAAPEAIRVASIRQLATMDATPAGREALLKHYNGSVPSLRVEALRALRTYELPRTLLEGATLDSDADIQREAWQQLDSRFDESAPISTRWRLYPRSRNEDIGTTLVAVTAVSAAIMALTALIAPIITAAFWKSLALFLTGAAASFVSWGFVVFVAIASQHQNGFAQKDVQQILCVLIAVLWLTIGVSWFIALRANRKNRAIHE